MDEQDEELQQAFRLSMQQQPSPEAKRSRPSENADLSTQRELRAAAAERRRTITGNVVLASPQPISRELESAPARSSRSTRSSSSRDNTQELPYQVAEQLYAMVFGHEVSKDVLAQWCNQGFRFSTDPETAFGLVQHEGGPCGVLAPIQATFLKYLLFVGDGARKSANLHFEDSHKTDALVQALGETLWRAGGGGTAVVAVLDVPDYDLTSDEEEQDKSIDRFLQGVSLDSVDGLRKVVRVFTATSLPALAKQLRSRLAVFRSRMGALLFLFSAVLSRGLDAVQSDRDDPVPPLVAPPFGHASQEIVNLLLCGHAVANVFDGNYDLGGGMSLKGIPSNVEVGLLTYLESLNFCKVGQYLKCPKWPIWVVGSETHYTVLFALDTGVQDENDLELRETIIRRAFDARDQSGGGGFISPDGLQQVLAEAKVSMPEETVSNLCNSDIVVWNDFADALFKLEKSKGGLKDDEGSTKKCFELFHFNGIAKTFGNNNNNSGSSSGVLQQRPRLTKLRVAVPPKWTPESMMVEQVPTAAEAMQTDESKAAEEPPQEAPLAACIRTRWQRAACNWSGDDPSIV